MDQLLRQYLSLTSAERRNHEFEVRFHSSNIGRTEYDQVIGRLKGLGYDLDIRNSKHTLKIMTSDSSVRTEIQGLHYIQQYCKSESLNEIDDKSIRYQEKSKGQKQDFPDFGFRIAFQEERVLNSNNVDEWENTRKTFRYMNRVTATHKDYPHLQVDLSIVRNSVREPKYTVKESNVFRSKNSYEIEIEYINTEDQVDVKTEVAALRHMITNVLSGIQDSMYPIGEKERTQVASEYMKLIALKDKRLFPKHFIGPSSISLELKNMKQLVEDYTVTDKADGKRKMMYIDKKDRVYFMTSNMNVQYTGMTCSKGYSGTLVDGEHIQENLMNMFAIFDIYFWKGDDVRSSTFVAKKDDEVSRHRLMKEFIKEVQFSTKHKIALDIQVKEFHFGKGDNVYAKCEKVLARIDQNMFPYETDGLIFTPAYTGVGIPIGAEPNNHRITWNASFKWKPPEFNTIDFLAITKKENGADTISYKEGSSVVSYKTLLLHVGFDENNPLHGYHNSCEMILHDKIVGKKRENTYEARAFQPTNPSDNHAMICNSILVQNSMIAENNEIIEDNTIIECRYDKTREQGWRWIPIRVRHDKTAEFRANLKNYGNAYHVANSVWKSIHQPVLRSYFQNPSSIPEDISDDDVYYNRKDLSFTQPLRDFHNIYVKNKLIRGVTNEGGTLFDVAVGKAGDLPKWIRSGLRFVMGVDVSADNINNPRDGACSRYLQSKKRNKRIPKAIFLQANSSLNIRSGDAVKSEQGKRIIENIFGLTAKNNTPYNLLTQMHGIGRNGFDVVSCQFALHYFFSSKDILDSFVRNVKECCRLDGYFIGTTYDGESVFELLQDKQKGDAITSYVKDHKIWEITKKYDMETFEGNETSIGYPIDVYQDSINKTFTEYLVHFDFFKRYMRSHGFELVTKEEAKKMGLPNSTGLFYDLFYAMKREKQNIYKNALQMENENELTKISFLNRYFIFQKVKEVGSMIMNNDEKKLENTRILKKDIMRILQEQNSDSNQYIRFIRVLKTIGYGNKLFDENKFMAFLNSIRKEDYTDYQIYMKYKDEVQETTLLPEKYDRSASRIRDISFFMKKFTSYLDYGCGDGSITRAVMKHFKLNKDSVYGADIKRYPSMDMNFISTENGKKMDLQDNSIEFVTVFMVLHHLEDEQQKRALRDIYRVIRPGGRLLIREHNALLDNGAFERVIDIVHDIYDYIIDAEIQWKDNNDYYSKYKGYKEWETIIEDVGFKKSKVQKRIYRNMNTNPMETYYRLYVKPEVKK